MYLFFQVLHFIFTCLFLYEDFQNNLWLPFDFFLILVVIYRFHFWFCLLSLSNFLSLWVLLMVYKSCLFLQITNSCIHWSLGCFRISSSLISALPYYFLLPTYAWRHQLLSQNKGIPHPLSLKPVLWYVEAHLNGWIILPLSRPSPS